MQEKRISQFSFHEFLTEFQEAVIDGFRLDLESNERFPQKYGSHLEVTLVQPEPYLAPEVLKQAIIVEATEITPEITTVTETPKIEPEVQAEIVEPKVKARKLKDKVTEVTQEVNTESVSESSSEES